MQAARLVLHVGLAGALSIALASSCLAQSGKSQANDKWGIRHSRLQLRLTGNLLVFEPKKIASVPIATTPGTEESDVNDEPTHLPSAIPVSAIVGIVREDAVHKPAEEARDRVLESLDPDNLSGKIQHDSAVDPFSIVSDPVSLALSAGVLQIFHGIRTKSHSVRILWTEDSELNSAVVELSERNASLLSGRLMQLTGKQLIFVDYDSETRVDHTSEMTVAVNRPIALGNMTIFSGRYRLLVLPDTHGGRMIYVFQPGPRTLSKAMVAYPAKPLPLGSEQPWKLRLAVNAAGTRSICEVNTDQERLRLPSCPSPMTPKD